MKQAAEIIHDKILPFLETQRQMQTEIAGTCPEHGEYTSRDAIVSYGQCPKCWARKEEQQAVAQRFSRFTDYSGVPRRFLRHKLEAFNPPTPAAEQVFSFLSMYAVDFPAHKEAGRCIIMAGRTGTGKTMLACAVARHIALAHEQSVRYTTAYHIVRDIKDTYRGNDRDSEHWVVHRHVEPDLLVIDEVGVQFGTDTEKLLLFEVLNGRYEDMKPTIIISNLELSGIGEYLGDRVMDRLRENSGAVLVFDWQSHRMPQ